MHDIRQGTAPTQRWGFQAVDPPEEMSRWLVVALDALDHGVVLVKGGRVAYLNRAAWRATNSPRAQVRCIDGRLLVEPARLQKTFERALDDAEIKGLRRLLSIGEGVSATTLSISPLSTGDGVLVVMGKAAFGEALMIESYARCIGLTPAESRLLVALCEGAAPRELAAQGGVALSTVRSQLSSIREKTGSPDLRALMRQMALLPPVAGLLV